MDSLCKCPDMLNILFLNILLRSLSSQTSGKDNNYPSYQLKSLSGVVYNNQALKTSILKGDNSDRDIVSLQFTEWFESIHNYLWFIY